MFNYLNMRAVPGDLKATATILRAAMRLFAERGFDGVSVRDIAAAAGVSASLVIHHYSSKQGLKEAADDRVLAVLGEVFSSAEGAGSPAAAIASMEALLAEQLEQSPVLMGYLRRLLVEGGPTTDDLYGRLFRLTTHALDDMRKAGILRRGPDEDLLATFLLINDLATVVFRDQIRATLGFDPLAGEGLQRWATMASEIYQRGVFTGPLPAEPPPAGLAS
jgi:AcrR family transcriptional regulator